MLRLVTGIASQKIAPGCTISDCYVNSDDSHPAPVIKQHLSLFVNAPIAPVVTSPGVTRS